MHLNWHYTFSYTGSCNLVIQVVLNTSCSFVDVSELRVYLLKMRPFLCWLSDWNLLASVAAIPHYWQLFYSSFWQWSWEGFHVKKKIGRFWVCNNSWFLDTKSLSRSNRRRYPYRNSAWLCTSKGILIQVPKSSKMCVALCPQVTHLLVAKPWCSQCNGQQHIVLHLLLPGPGHS